MHIELGNLAEWFGAIGTVAVFVGGLLVISNDRKARTEEIRERQWDQAQKITTSTDAQRDDQSAFRRPGQDSPPVIYWGSFNVHNGSTRPIFNCLISYQTRDPSSSYTQYKFINGKERFGRIEAGQSNRCSVKSDRPFDYEGDGSFFATMLVEWDDVGGTHWLLDTDGSLYRNERYIESEQA